MSNSATITVRVPRELKRQMEKVASAEARTVSNLAAILLERGVRHLTEPAEHKIPTRAKQTEQQPQ